MARSSPYSLNTRNGLAVLLFAMTTKAQPLYYKRFAVVIVVSLCLSGSTGTARLPNKTSALNGVPNGHSGLVPIGVCGPSFTLPNNSGRLSLCALSALPIVCRVLRTLCCVVCAHSSLSAFFARIRQAVCGPFIPIEFTRWLDGRAPWASFCGVITHF